MIQPQKTLVFWFNNLSKTPAEFNSNFGSSLPEEQLISFKDQFPGFANTGNRGIAIKNKAGQTMVSASYLANETDNNGKVVQYQYPKTNVEMSKLAVLANPTPGTLESTQVPLTPVNLNEIPEDLVAPVIGHSPVTASEAYTDIAIEANVTDDASVPYATLYYKKEGAENFTAISMNSSAESPARFTVSIPSIEVESNLIYYIEASDGKNSSRTEEYKITVAQPNLDFNKLPALLVTEWYQIHRM